MCICTIHEAIRIFNNTQTSDNKKRLKISQGYQKPWVESQTIQKKNKKQKHDTKKYFNFLS